MEFPKLVYEDFYKFLMSLGIIIFLIGLSLGIFFPSSAILNQWLIFTIFLTIVVISCCFVIWAGKRWYKNQKFLDAKLEAESQMARLSVQGMVKPDTGLFVDTHKTQSNVALVICKISSVLPGAVAFNFLTDWQVWFSIENHEAKKYIAYIKIKFISDEYQEDVSTGHYGGDTPWNLEPFALIMAPGLGISETIKEKARQKKRIEIKIFCTVKDKDNKLVEEKFPVAYIYDYDNNNWFYNP